ncbi:MAG TPA: hypothetical protein VF317_13835 [Dermatophilaceae bacterium]
MTGELDEHIPHAAVGTMDEDGLTGPDLCLVQHLPGGDAIDHHGLGICGVDAVRNRNQVAGIDERVRRPSSGLDDGSDATPDH